MATWPLCSRRVSAAAVFVAILACGLLLLFVNVLLSSQPATLAGGSADGGSAVSRSARVVRGAFPRALAVIRSLATKGNTDATSKSIPADYRLLPRSDFNPASSAVSRFPPLSFPRCADLYREELWTDSYFAQTRADLRERRGATAAGDPEHYLDRMYEPALNVRVDRNVTALGGRILRSDAEVAALTSPFLFVRPSLHPLEAEADDSWLYVASPSASGAVSAFTQRFASAVDKLMIVAHPDDESLFGFLDLASAQHERDAWIELQQSRLKRANSSGSSASSSSAPSEIESPPPGWKVVVVTNSFTPNRLSELSAALSALGVHHWECLSHLDSLTTRLRLDSRLVLSLADLIYSRPWNQIVTHGLEGEYGHYQHRLLSRVVHSLVFSPPKQHWPHANAPDSTPEIQPTFDSPHDAWKRHRFAQLRDDASSSGQPDSAFPRPLQRFPFEHALHVFASYRDHQRYRVRADAYQSYLAKQHQLRDASTAAAAVPSADVSLGMLVFLLREVDAQTQSLGALPPLPPSMSEALFLRKLAHLERWYPSQWANLQRFHQMSIQFSDLSLPAHRVFQSLALRRSIDAELDERAMHTGDPAPVDAWNRRSDAALWRWQDHSCEG